ncbi:MAG TPA: alpha-amylase, partial [Chryseosolibacter sp.]|nr:alpha-amylase [Chryseosolibacter sp.]
MNKLRFFDICGDALYFDDEQNRTIMERVARQCYLPTNALLLKLIEKYPNIRVTFSISGIAIDQLEQYAPEALDSFKKLAATGCVDFLTETYYHSLACLMPGNEFELQVAKHQKKILRQFGVLSKVFRNTELIYSDDTGSRIHKMGFKGVLIDGVDRALRNQSTHLLYSHPEFPELKLIPRDHRLSDAIAFRFSRERDTMTADHYVNWLKEIPAAGDLINIG